jgi:hypothetical protein
VIRDVPAATPVRKPEVDPMVATAVLELVHMPPGTPSKSVDVLPAHKVVMPVIGVGVGLTVIVVVVKQPVGNV